MAELRKHETALLWSIRLGIFLVLFTPLVVAPTIYPFVVGKALYSRTLIEVVVGLWALLVLVKPQFRPPRSWLLLLLALGLAWSFVTAYFGVSFQRSMWSDYERMTGWIDAAHWFAFAVVVVSVFRSFESLRMLFNVQLFVGVLVALVAVWQALARAYDLPSPREAVMQALALTYDPRLPELNHLRPEELDQSRAKFSGFSANANLLGAYCMGNVFIALGLFASSFSEWRAKVVAPAEEQRRGKREQKPAFAKVASLRVFWALVALMSLGALILGSRSIVVFGSLGFGVLVLIVAWAWLAKRRVLRAAAAAAVALVLVAGVAGASVAIQIAATVATDHGSIAHYRRNLHEAPAGSYVTNVRRLSAIQRVAAIEAGLKGLADRPLLGWGSDNFLVVWGRYVGVPAADLEVHHRAHNKIVEEGVAKGLLGVVAYLALWGLAFFAVVRKIKRAKAKAPNARMGSEEVFVLFIGAALAAYFVQSQGSFDSVTLMLQHMILFAAIVHLAPMAWRWRERAASESPLWLRVPLTIGCLALVGAGLTTNRAICDAVTEIVAPVERGRPAAHFERAIRTFEPLAYEPWRRLLGETLVLNWKEFRVVNGAEAKRLLLVARQEGERALAAEPENWWLHLMLVQLYETVAKTEPDYASLATYHCERQIALAPSVSRRWRLHDGVVQLVPYSTCSKLFGPH